jgi:MSHA pilin protein MshC
MRRLEKSAMMLNHKNNGFTLVELVAMIVIISIISVFAIGQLGFTTTLSQKGVYDKLRAGLEYAAKAAVAQRRYVCVCVGASCTPANSVAFTVDTQSPDSGSNFCASTATQLVLPVADKDCGGAFNAVCSRANATIAAAGAVTLFNFNPQGQASTNAGVITNIGVTVTGENNLTGSSCSASAISVCVNGATGYVQ